METPQHKLGQAILDEMTKLGGHFDIDPEKPDLLLRTVRNTGLVVDALNRAANDTGYMALCIFLTICEREKAKEEATLASA